ncbi:MAG: substrate-binding domain-containing protein [Pseudomonadota bacterium]
MTSAPSPSGPVHVLSGGAAQGLVTQLQDRFSAQYPSGLAGTFGAVGMMKDKLLAGEPCDVIILSDALIAQLTASAHLVAGSAQALGAVKTGVAVKTGDKPPDVGSPEALKTALRSANGIYFPDPVKATAGIHFMRVLKALGLETELAGRLRPFPNGAAAMKAMAETNEPGLLGCTQVTEIIFAPGVLLAGALPREFELATVYTAALSNRAAQPRAATALIELLTSPEAAGLRSAGGFEPLPE